MLFKNVTDITIPQGNVIKIHETVGGRVLWEKKEKLPLFTKIASNINGIGYLSDNTGLNLVTMEEHSYIDCNIRSGCFSLSTTDVYIREAGYNTANFEWYADYSTFPQGIIARAKRNDSTRLRIWFDVVRDGLIFPADRDNYYAYLKVYCVSKTDKAYTEDEIRYKNTSDAPKVVHLSLEHGAEYDDENWLVCTENTYQVPSISTYSEFYNFLQS